MWQRWCARAPVIELLLQQAIDLHDHARMVLSVDDPLASEPDADGHQQLAQVRHSRRAQRRVREAQAFALFEDMRGKL